MSRPRYPLVVVDDSDTRLGVQDDREGGAFVWVGRSDDNEDDERVVLLSKKEIKRLIKALKAARRVTP